jgi:hypothetical protein
MRFHGKYITIYFYTYILILTFWSLILYLTHQRNTPWNNFYNIAYAFLYFSVGIIALLGTRLNDLKSTVGKELLSIAIGMFGFAIGLFIWFYYNTVLKIEIPYPSLADIFFVLYIPFLGYGIIKLLNVFGLLFSKRILLEAVTIFIISGIIILKFGNPPGSAASLSFFAQALNIFYLLGDTFLITLGIMLIRLTKGKIHNSFFYFIGALIIMAGADIIFSYRTAYNSYWNGDISDLLYAVSGFLFGLGVTRIVSDQSVISNTIPSSNIFKK